jgi:PAS domain S-box-containing protein
MTRVLHIDDHEDEYLLTKLQLERLAEDIELDWAETIGEALEKLRAGRYDCILSDFQLPERDGLELLDELRSRGDETPFIFLTGQGSEQVAASALRMGADDYFIKDTGIAFYQRLLNSIIRLVQAHSQLVAHRKAVTALRESERRYRMTLNSMADAIHVVDRELRIALMNKVFRELMSRLGLGGDVIGKSVFKVFPFLPDIVRQEYESVFATGEIVETEEANEIKGRLIHTKTRKIPIVHKGKVVSVVTVMKDITRQKLGEDALKGSEARFRELTRSLPTAILELDLSGRIVLANPAAYDLFKISPRKMADGMQFTDLLTPRDRKRAKHDLDELTGGRQNRIRGSYRVKGKGKKQVTITVEITTVAQIDKVEGLRVVVLDPILGSA